MQLLYSIVRFLKIKMLKRPGDLFSVTPPESCKHLDATPLEQHIEPYFI